VNALGRSTKRPVADLAERYGLKASQVRDVIHEARVRGLLTESRRGQASGQLTDEAIELLSKEGTAEL
jgi:transposase-like protein